MLPLRGPWVTLYLRGEPLLAAAALAPGLFAQGLDSAAGRGWAMIFSGAMLAVALLARRPPAAWWRRIAPVLGAVGLASVWLIVGHVLGAGSTAAPDLVLPALLGTFAGIAALLTGCLIGWSHGPVLMLAERWVLLAALSFVAGIAAALDPATFGITAWRDQRFVGLVGNANVLSAVAGVVALLASARAVSRARSARRRLPAGAFVMGDGGAVRDGHPARRRIALSVSADAALPCRTRDAADAGGRVHPLLLLVVVAAPALLILTRLANVLGGRFGLLADDAPVRAAMWSAYLGQWWQRPWFGAGPGGFPSVNAAALSDPGLAQQAWTVNSAHDVALQLLLAGGAPYLAAMIAAAALIARPVLRYFRRRRSPEAVALALSVVLLAGCASVDIVLDVPLGAILAAFLTGLIWGEALARTAR